jgi:glycosyltransferase involved in cell wall biosynthesis
VLIVLDVSAGRATVQVRGLRFEESFLEHGWQVEFVATTTFSEDQICIKARDVDAVYLIKIRSLRLVKRLKAQGAKVIFDLTDALWQWRYRRLGWWDLEAIMVLSDAIFSENEYVCEYARRYNPRVVSIPVCTQVERFDDLRLSSEPPPSDRIVIGWVGSPSTIEAIEKFRGVLEAVGRRHPNIELVLLGTGSVQLPAWPFRTRTIATYDEEVMIREILAMHIGIYPPPEDLEDYRIRGAHKALLYMTGGVAAVAQRAGDCERKIEDGVTGMLASTHEEWVRKLNTLVESPELRAKIAQAGADVVRAEHSLAHVFDKLATALELVISTPALASPAVSDVVRARVPAVLGKVRSLGERIQRRTSKLLGR